MSRIALYGENSVVYINTLLDIWNNGNCAVLIDSQTPVLAAVKMMREAKVQKCYVEHHFFYQFNECADADFELIMYDSPYASTQLLPEDVFNKFQKNYSREEAVVIYSSGTTGQSKGVILTHYAINTNADAIIDYMNPDQNDCIYLVKKIAHASTLTGELLVALKTRTSLLVGPVIVPPRYILGNIAKYKVSIIGLNPTLLALCMNEYLRHKYKIDNLKKMYISGAVLDDMVYERACQVFEKQRIFNVYGLSEAAPRVAAQRDEFCRNNSVGRPIKNVEVMIVDKLGAPVENTIRGIVHVNSPCLYSGYVCGEVKYQSLYKDWLNTGDIGYFDVFGELHIVGRVDDMIVIGAHKIYPAEVEQQIKRVTDVDECVVVMVTVAGEGVLCCMYTANEEIQDSIRNELGRILMKYEIPQNFIKVDEIPKTKNGKTAMQDVRRMLCAELERRY